MSSGIGEEPVPSISPGSSQPSGSLEKGSSRVRTPLEMMNVSPLDAGASVQPSPTGDGASLASVTVKDALKKQEWLDTQLHKLKVQLYMKKLGNIMKKINEPVREKTNKLGSDQDRKKSSCTVTEDDQCKAIDSLSIDELNTLHRKLQDELTIKTAVVDGQEQILRGEHLLKTTQDILNEDTESEGDGVSVDQKKELENLLNEFTQASTEAAREQKEIVRLKSELTDLKKTNFDLLKKSRKLYDEIDRKKKLKEEELETLSSDPVGKRLHEDLKTKLQVNRVHSHILQGLIMGSGVNWAQDETLQKLLLETAQPDQL